MNSQKIKLISKFHLSSLLVTLFVIEVIIAFGLTGWLVFRNGQKNVTELIDRINDRITEKVEQDIKTFANTPHQFFQINLAMIRIGNLNLNDHTIMRQYFWELTQISDAVPYLYFANQEGDFIGVWRQNEHLTTLSIKNQLTDSYREIHQLDRQGRPMALIRREKFDPRLKSWYQSALKARSATWSEIYVFGTAPRLGITHVLPIYDRSESLQGVLAADLTLSNISDFLSELSLSESGIVFIMERSGKIVASSVAEPPFLKTENGEKRLFAKQSNHPLIRQAAHILQTQFKSLNHIQQSQRFLKEIEGQPHFIQVSTIEDGHGLDWLVTIVIPKTDLTKQIDANTRNTLYLSLIALTLSILSGIATSRWISKSVQSISEASHKLARGDLSQQVKSSKIEVSH